MHFRIFGCTQVLHQVNLKKKKMSEAAKKGGTQTANKYRSWDGVARPPTGKKQSGAAAAGSSGGRHAQHACTRLAAPHAKQGPKPSEWWGRGGRSQPECSDFWRFRPVCRRNFWSRAPMTMRPRTARGRIVPWGVCDFGGPGPRGCCVLPAKTRSFSRPFWPPIELRSPERKCCYEQG